MGIIIVSRIFAAHNNNSIQAKDYGYATVLWVFLLVRTVILQLQQPRHCRSDAIVVLIDYRLNMGGLTVHLQTVVVQL